jgi:hypothetical protein
MAVSTFVALGSSSAYALPSLSNGSFETPLAGSPSTPFSNGTPGLAWSGSAGAVEVFSSPFGSPAISAYQGNQFAELQYIGMDTLSQTVTGVTPGMYAFSFAHAGRQGTGDNVLKFEVKDTSNPLNVLFSQTYTANYSNDTTPWNLRTGTWSTTATSVDFVFTAISTSLYPVGCPTIGSCQQPGNGNFIDAVTVNEVPGPLPLMGAATAFAYSRRIRRRIKIAQA